MSIGEHLAAARQQAGLTVKEVSQRTRIRETIVRGVEKDEYTECGGDFYVRGFIRAIAREVGADPEPLVREYDAAHPAAQQAVATAGFLGPVTSVDLRRRRGPNWTAALAVAAVVAFGVVAYLFVAGSGHAHRVANHGRPPIALPTASATSSPSTSPAPVRYVREVSIRLTATADCWVEFTTPDGSYLAQYFLTAGTSQTWVFGRAVNMRLGNPAGVKLLVNGKNPLPAHATQPITLALDLQSSTG